MLQGMQVVFSKFLKIFLFFPNLGYNVGERSSDMDEKKIKKVLKFIEDYII